MECCCAWAPPLSLPCQDGGRCFPPPLPACLSACRAARCPARETYGVAMVRLRHRRRGEARAVHRERGMPMTRKGGVLVPAPVPFFWPKPSRTLGLFSVTRCIERSPGFALPSILVPLRRGADRDIGPSRFRCQPVGCGSIVRRRCTSRYLPAHLRRIPLMGQRVVSWHHATHNNDYDDFMSQPSLR